MAKVRSFFEVWRDLKGGQQEALGQKLWLVGGGEKGGEEKLRALLRDEYRIEIRPRTDAESGIVIPDVNPFKRPADELLGDLRIANAEEKFGIREEDFVRLAATSPEFPVGREAYLSFRLRFGTGRDGVIETFERHIARIKRVFGEKDFWRWEYLLSGEHPFEGKPVDRLRLLAGNERHQPAVEWIVVPDLSAFRKRQSVEDVRNDLSLADEGLVLAWLYDKRVRLINYDDLPAWFCAGYESNVPESDAESWQRVPVVDWNRDCSQVELRARWRGNDDSNYSVPSSRECPAAA